MRILISLVALALLAGCATSPVAYQKANPAPPDRLYAHQQHGDGAAPIQVTRDQGMVGMACGAVVSVDGDKAAKLAHGETARFWVAPGSHIVGVAANGGICSSGVRETQVDAKAGQVTKLRISMGNMGDMDIAPTAY